MQRKHYLVSGLVQGVGFRSFSAAQARSLNLSGSVRNLRDGRVEIDVEGPENALAEFERAIRQGPSHSKVTDVQTRELELRQINSGVMIEKDGEEPWSFE